jgi:hypothetical protein
MTTDEQPDQTGTWEPDWRLLKQTRDKAITNIPYDNDDQFNEQAYSAIVREYRRQQAAQGIVEVRREDLEWLLEYVCDEDHTNWHRPQAQRVDAILTATEEQQ